MSKEFIKKEKYPSPSRAFSFSLEPINNIKHEALIILDANVLLLPFTANSDSISAIKNLYSKLVESDQIFLPAHAVREYLDNRATKISNIYTTLSKKSNEGFKFLDKQPLLEGIDKYDKALELEEEIRSLIKDYQNKIREIVKEVEEWGWDDPVSKVYHDILSDRVIDDSHIDYSEISKDFKRRSDLRIPPGYKDKDKEENQSGDLIIWKEILNIAKQKNKHVIFVSGDNKSDWWHQGDGKNLYPRFELVDEFRRTTEAEGSEGSKPEKGKSFHIVSLSKLLKMFEVDEEVVSSVKHTEKNSFKEDFYEEMDSENYSMFNDLPNENSFNYKDDKNYRKILGINKDNSIDIETIDAYIDGSYSVKEKLIFEEDENEDVVSVHRVREYTKTTAPFTKKYKIERVG